MLFRDVPDQLKDSFDEEIAKTNLARIKVINFFVFFWLIIVGISDFVLMDDPDVGHLFRQYVVLDIILTIYIVSMMLILWKAESSNSYNAQLIRKYFFYPHITIFMIWMSLVSAIEISSMGSSPSMIVTAFSFASFFYIDKKYIGLLFILSFVLINVFTFYNDFEINNYIEINMVLATMLVFAYLVSRFVFNQKLDQFIAVHEKEIFNDQMREEIKTREVAESKLRKTTEELEDSLHKEKELGELKSRFITLVSHEFRTPLTVIQTSNSLQEIAFQRGRKEKFLKHNKNINLAIKNLTMMVEDVLFFDRKESKKLQVNLGEIELIDLVEESVEKVKVAMHSKHNIQIQKSVVEITILSDSILVQKIIMNLLSNAIKFSEPKSIITIAVLDSQKNVRLQITDKGVGIPESEIEAVHKPFIRGSNVQDYQGVGLGLSIVVNCLEMLDGKMKIESELDKGTSIAVSIPKKHE